LPRPCILLYHRIADDPIDGQLLCVSPRHFDEQLQYLKANYRVIPLRQLVEELMQGSVVEHTVALTFDDGYADNFQNALPILEQHEMHATFFVTSGMVGSDKAFWWDALERIFFSGRSLPSILKGPYFKHYRWLVNTPDQRLSAYDQLIAILKTKAPEVIDLIVNQLFEWAGAERTVPSSQLALSKQELIRLAASDYAEIGAHTMHHPRLTVLSPERQWEELYASKESLERVVGSNVELLSYPYGSVLDFDVTTVELARQAGYIASCANVQKKIDLPIDCYRIPRLLVRNWDREHFSIWLESENKDVFERNELELRKKRVAACDLTQTSDGSLKAKSFKIITKQWLETHGFDEISEKWVYFARPGYDIEPDKLEAVCKDADDHDVIVLQYNPTRKDGTPFYRKVAINADRETISLSLSDSTILPGVVLRTTFLQEVVGIGSGPLLQTNRYISYKNVSVNVTAEKYLTDLVNGHDCVYLYGAGHHTRDLLEQFADHKPMIRAIIDKNAKSDGQMLFGFPVYGAGKLKELEPGLVLLSSAEFEDEMYNELIQQILPHTVKKIYSLF